MRLFLLVFLFLSLSASAVEPTCESRLTYQEIFVRWAAEQSRRATGIIPHRSEDVYKRFWRNTWPALRALAADGEVTVGEFLKDIMALMQLLEEERGRGDTAHEIIGLILKDIQTLETIDFSSKLKPRHWELVRRVYLLFVDLGHRAIYLEQNRHPYPSFNPYDEVTPAQLDLILDSLEDVALDDVMAVSPRYKKQDKPAEETKPEISEATPTAEPEGVPAPVSLPPTDQLAVVLRENYPLSTGLVYQARTVWGRELRITLSPELAAQAQGAEKRNIRRLLRGIFVGRGDTSGIKMLANLGPGIVELKARMRGQHKRILGCLKGDELKLRELVTLPPSIAAYAARIPPNYCD